MRNMSLTVLILLAAAVACSKERAGEEQMSSIPVAAAPTGGELTRDEAKRLLSEKSDYPRKVGSEVVTKEELDQYLGKQWLKTDMSQGRVLVAECIETVDEVTGVSVEGTQATVEYRTKYERNPLRGSPCSDKPVHKALFQKFDDGWRVDMPRAME